MSDLNIQNKQVRTRLAPSPTGFIHIGTFRTGLFGFLFARHHGGVNVLRIEDTDQTREVDGAVENLLTTMQRLGVEFDEGPYLENGVMKTKGDFGPYVQSERLEIYHKYVKDLIEAKQAYYCFCSSERLEDLRKEQVALKKPPMYDKHCRKLSDEEITTMLSQFQTQNKQPVVRQAIPEEGQTVIKDLVYGSITYDHKTLDDQVLLKSDGFPTYHLAVVVDDHLMQITHVFRGEEWIPSTPKHILLYKSFGWEPPQFAHMPLILNPNRSKLSKRQGDVAAEDFLNKGYLPEALINFVAFLGWNPKTEEEIFSLEELIKQFDLAKVNNSGAVFDLVKLDWINGYYIRQKTNTELLELLKPFWQNVDFNKFNAKYLEEVVAIEKERLKTLAQINQQTEFYFEQPKYEKEILVWKKADSNDAKQKLLEVVSWFEQLDDAYFTNEKLEAELKTWISSKGYDTGAVLWPLRVSLTGLERSPSPFEVAVVLYKGLGREALISRIKFAIDLL